MTIEQVAILFNPYKPKAQVLAEEIRTWLARRGVTTLLLHPPELEGPEHLARLRRAQLALTVGGDGTMLMAARAIAAPEPPILGIAMGSLSFIAEVDPALWTPALERVLEGDGWREPRWFLEARVGEEAPILGLNEAAVARGRLPRALRLAVRVDGAELGRFQADAVLVASATGSTAYALAAGGPILDPSLPNLVLVTVAPHPQGVPPLVLPADAEVEVEITGDGGDPILAVDGWELRSLEAGRSVRIRRSSRRCTFLRLGPRNDFYRNLLRRLRLTE